MESQNSQFFTKISGDIKINGKIKAAMLLGELTSSSADCVLSYLKPEEKQKLRDAFYRLGTKVDFAREIAVLQQANNFGVAREIAQPIHTDEEIKSIIDYEQAKINISTPNMKPEQKINLNPEDIAKVLGTWLRED
ncbi:MAG: hypothetical protein SO116_09360 [Treponema sp.]|nr:hypothetical protein [Spirochaetia bacterium]MDD7013851.1 hypothetical protein [Spirochaetales bacterium]MDY4903059.1 hypothetical protein [Treponema sp.]